MRYIGEGSRLRMVSIDTSGLNESSHTEAMMTAELLWYLHEGLDIKTLDHPSFSQDFKEFIIELNEVDHSLTFLQSNKSGKWWLQKEGGTKEFISCAYEEYEEAINHEIPDRLLKLM